MTDRIYRQTGTPDTQYLTIEATPGGNVVFRVSDLKDSTVSEFTTDAAQGEYIGNQLTTRLSRHHGYRNYETFAVCSTLDNDSDLQMQSATIARIAAAGEEYPDVAAAKALREWFEDHQLTEKPGDNAEDLLSGAANMLLNAALGDVDWLEVARTRLALDIEI